MAKRRVVTNSTENLESTSANLPSPAESTLGTTRRQLVLKLTADGKLDVDSMRPQTRETLKSALKDTPLFEKPLDLKERKDLYLPLVGPIYSLLGALETWIVARQTKLPYDEVRSVMSYSDVDIALLADPTATVMAKRLPSDFAWAEESSLVLTLLAVHQQKFAMLAELKSKHSEPKAEVKLEEKEETDT